MPHTVNPIPTVVFNSYASGTSAEFTISVSGAVQPASTATGSISVEFNGETASAPLTVEFNELVVPAASAVLADPRLAVSFGPATVWSGVWSIPTTITVV